MDARREREGKMMEGGAIILDWFTKEFPPLYSPASL